MDTLKLFTSLKSNISAFCRYMGSCMLVMLISFGTLCSQKSREDIGEDIDSILEIIKTSKILGHQEKSDLADSAFILSQQISDSCRQAHLRVYHARQLDELGLLDSALNHLFWAQSILPAHCDTSVWLDLKLNFSSLFLSLGELGSVGDLAACDSVCRQALALISSNPHLSEWKLSLLNNLAISQFYRGDTSAGHSFRLMLAEARRSNDQKNIRAALNNLGSYHGVLGNFDSAHHYADLAASVARADTSREVYLAALINLANVYGSLGYFDRALDTLNRVIRIASNENNKHLQADALLSMSETHKMAGNLDVAYDSLQAYIRITKEILDQERVRSISEMKEKYESEKKARHIQQLELEKLDYQLEKERITSGRNRIMYGGIVAILIALALWSRLYYVRRSQKAVQRERDVSDQLLLNILPATVAEELKVKGTASAKHFPKATIMFSDFAQFTPITEVLSAEDLVAELNLYFKAFDAISTKYGIEKIKTFGDAYMAAAGIPDTNKATAKEMIYAAIEMLAFVDKHKAERDEEHLAAFEMRVGLHTGPVVAGIVGVKKFQYDLWGDTVNIASRMESSGHIGKVNISEATYSTVKDVPEFKFTPRGMVEAKGKGQLMMYYVELA